MSVPAYDQSARDYISIVGSSTVYPFATAVAEQFGKDNSRFKTPKVESTGTGGGFKLFCSGIGVQYPDIVNASREIKKSELENCTKNGVTDIIEINIGLDSIVLASNRKNKQIPLTIKDLWLALAKNTPDTTGNLVINKSKTWKDINPDLPDTKIEILGPPQTSGTRDAFVDLIMNRGCREFEAIRIIEKADEKKANEACRIIRGDGIFIEVGENDNLIVNKLVANPNALGIFGYNFLEENLDKIQGETVNGITPSIDNIIDGKYPVLRPLFIYVKKAHIGVIPSIREFITEFTSEKAVGEDGYLSRKGLISLSATKRKLVAAEANNLKTLAP